MGIADGVYQWREQGIDAGEFSRLLMHTALEAVEEGQPDVLKGLQLPNYRLWGQGSVLLVHRKQQAGCQQACFLHHILHKSLHRRVVL